MPDGTAPVLAQMTALFEQEHASILAVQDVALRLTRQYGIVSTSPYRDGVERVSGIVEKPDPAHVPSTLAVVGRYILGPEVFDKLAALSAGARGEIQFTDGIEALTKEVGGWRTGMPVAGILAGGRSDRNAAS